MGNNTFYVSHPGKFDFLQGHPTRPFRLKIGEVERLLKFYLHPFRSHYDEVPPVDLRAMALHIQKFGLKCPVLIDPKISVVLDGHVRLQACLQYNLTHLLRAQYWYPTGVGETPDSFVSASRHMRRKLTKSQKAIHGAALILEAASSVMSGDTVLEGSSINNMALQLGVSRSMVRAAVRIRNNCSDQDIQDCELGRVSVNNLMKDVLQDKAPSKGPEGIAPSFRAFPARVMISLLRSTLVALRTFCRCNLPKGRDRQAFLDALMCTFLCVKNIEKAWEPFQHTYFSILTMGSNNSPDEDREGD